MVAEAPKSTAPPHRCCAPTSTGRADRAIPESHHYITGEAGPRLSQQTARADPTGPSTHPHRHQQPAARDHSHAADSAAHSATLPQGAVAPPTPNIPLTTEDPPPHRVRKNPVSNRPEPPLHPT